MHHGPRYLIQNSDSLHPQMDKGKEKLSAYYKARKWAMLHIFIFFLVGALMPPFLCPKTCFLARTNE